MGSVETVVTETVTAEGATVITETQTVTETDKDGVLTETKTVTETTTEEAGMADTLATTGGSAYSADFENPVAEEVKVENFPREGPNNKVTELDLCVWETLFMESLKVLNKWEQFKDIAHLLGNGEHGNSWD